MKIKIIILKIIILITSFKTLGNPLNIGLAIVATGRYIEFVPQLLTSARIFFFPGENVKYFIFTDKNFPNENDPDVLVIKTKQKGWPMDTLTRFHEYYANKEIFEDLDYIFACDADMLFIDNFGDEALSSLVGVLHLGFMNSRGSYEFNSKSLAYVKNTEGKNYFAGGIYGGSKKEFINMIFKCKTNIDIDLSNNIIAIWHDESHLNRFFIDNPPTLILGPSYCFPEPDLPRAQELKLKPVLLCLKKEHEKYRV